MEANYKNFLYSCRFDNSLCGEGSRSSGLEMDENIALYIF